MIGANSLQNTERFRLHVTASLNSVKVHATGEIGGVELDFVVAGVDVAIH